MISVMEGGISKPRVPAPAKVPIIIFSGYCRERSSGIDILPTVATVAADEPEIAAKTVQPAILTCSSPPGNLYSNGARPRNRFSDNRVRNSISPIQMNNGKAVKVQLDAEPHIVVAIASPTGRLVNSIIPIAATPIRLTATQTPVPRNRNRIVRKITVKVISSTSQLPWLITSAEQTFEEMMYDGDSQQHRAYSNNRLWLPEQYCICSFAEFVELPGVVGQANHVPRKVDTYADCNAQAPDFCDIAKLSRQPTDQDFNANMSIFMKCVR